MLDQSGYIKINNTKYNPRDFSYTNLPIENVMTSKSGKDLITATRLAKKEFTVSWEGLTYSEMSALEAYTYLNSVTVTWESNTYTCRARNGQSKMIRYSERYTKSDGMWNFSMTLTEL